MKITDVKIRVIDNAEKLKATASVSFDDCFVVREIKVIENKDNGLFVSMPSRRIPGDTPKYADIAHPLTTEFREVIVNAVLEAYKKALEERKEA